MKKKEIDDEPIIIRKGDKEIVLTEDKIKKMTAKFLEMCSSKAELFNDFGMSAKMVDMLLKAKQIWYPATQKNLNLNVENFDNKLQLWLKARAELKKAQKEAEVKYVD